MLSGHVSVIIIFFNAEKYLEEAIQSVLSQTYRCWELLLVDDGSTDGSTAIASAHAARDPGRIRCLRHPGGENRGMSATRNLGITEARGEYIAFLDADDVWLPEKLERQVALFAAFPRASMVYGPTLLWYSWTGRPQDAGRDYPRWLGVTPEQLVEPPALIPRFLRHEAVPPSTCGILVRRSAALRVGGFEESFRGMHEDQAFLYKLCLHEPVYVTANCWDKYRQHGQSFSALAEADGYYDGNGPNRAQRTFLEWFRSYALASGRMEQPIEDALEVAFWPYRHPLRGWLHSRLRRYRWRLAQMLRPAR